jgi:hypothetical protein
MYQEVKVTLDEAGEVRFPGRVRRMLLNATEKAAILAEAERAKPKPKEQGKNSHKGGALF